MSNLDLLKTILKEQKTAIESKGGTVTVSGTNPSPSEITAGIETITSPNLSLANAQASDVLLGKTFYAIDGELKTGNLEAVFTKEEFKHLIYANDITTPTYQGTYEYHIPEWFTYIRPYFFYDNPNNIDLYLNENLVSVEDSAFSNCPNITLKNLPSLKKLTKVGKYGFQNFKGIDLNALPETLTTVGLRGFFNCHGYTSSNFVLSKNLTSVEIAAFGSQNRFMYSSFDLNNAQLTVLPSQMLINLRFDCDFTTPDYVKVVNTYFCANGGFKNVTITPNVTTLGVCCFGAQPSANVPVDELMLQTLTIENVTPPVIQANIVPASIVDRIKIYVPDESVEAYKAVKNLAYVKNIIYPISQKV